MRLPAAVQPKQAQRHEAAALKLLGRFLSAPPLPRAQRAPVRLDELPADLDQRVRLVGEW
jgi:hypothetical protein